MTILKLKIDNIDYEIECKKGEENLLRKAEQLLNSNLNNNPHLKALSQSKKFLMLSLVLAADLSSSKKQVKDEIDFSITKNLKNSILNILKDCKSQRVTGKTILLSPAASSFDQFNNFENRGEEFKKLCNLYARKFI